jgi:hypothetical protein
VVHISKSPELIFADELGRISLQELLHSRRVGVDQAVEDGQRHGHLKLKLPGRSLALEFRLRTYKPPLDCQVLAVPCGPEVCVARVPVGDGFCVCIGRFRVYTPVNVQQEQNKSRTSRLDLPDAASLAISAEWPSNKISWFRVTCARANY